jgi:uncharacterized protein involved in exopolysaccharide biosynthesis
MADQSAKTMSRRAVCEVIYRHKKKVLLIPLVSMLVGALAILYLPRKYRSEAQIFLRLGRENIGLDPTATTSQTVLTPQPDRKDEVLSVINVIQSRGVAAQVVDRIGAQTVLSGGAAGGGNSISLAQIVVAPLRLVANWLRQIDPVSDRERAIVELKNQLGVHADRGSTLLTISYDAKTPAAAQQVCSAVVEAYRQAHMRIHRNEDSRPFFAEQRDRLREQLDTSLDALRKAKNETGLSTVAQRRESLESQYNSVELARLTLQQKLATSQAQLADLEQQLAQVSERQVHDKKSVPNSGADLLRQQLYTLQVQSMDLEARYNEAHPLVQAVKEQVREAQRLLASQTAQRTETTDSINPIHQQLSLALRQEQSRCAGFMASLAQLNEQRESVQTSLRALNDHELTIDQLTRRVDLARGNFLHYAQNMEEARIDQELESGGISNLSIVHTATLAEKPVSPSKPLVALATLIFATAGTAAIVLASEVLNDRLRTEDDVTRELDLPVLGTIPGGSVCRVFPVSANGTAAAGGRVR